MYALVDIAGKQYKVAENDKIHVPSMKKTKGDTVTFDRVLMVAGDNGFSIGTPTVEGASVEATVLGDVKDEKVIVFKKKRRKGYRVKRGHRQAFTQVQITKIGK